MSQLIPLVSSKEKYLHNKEWCIYELYFNGKYLKHQDICMHIYTHLRTHTHTMEYYSAVKINKLQLHGLTLMKLASIILNEREKSCR